MPSKMNCAACLMVMPYCFEYCTMVEWFWLRNSAKERWSTKVRWSTAWILVLLSKMFVVAKTGGGAGAEG